MFHRLKAINAESDFMLKAEFLDGQIKWYDVKPLFNEIEAFTALKTIPGLFTQVKVDTGGYGISWNDYIDLACDEIWENGKEEVSS